jgi:hypothetical protein
MLAGKQAAITAQPHEPVLKAERILMVDLVTSQTQAKGAAPSINRKGGQTKTTMASPLSMPSPPSTDGVDRLYDQLAEIHSIAAAQLVECAHWLQSDLMASPVHARAGWQTPIVEPSTTMMAPPPPTDFSPQALPWRGG